MTPTIIRHFINMDGPAPRRCFVVMATGVADEFITQDYMIYQTGETVLCDSQSWSTALGAINHFNTMRDAWEAS